MAVQVSACAPTSTSVGRGGRRGHCFKGDGVGNAALREESSVTPLRGLILGGDRRRLLAPCRLESVHSSALSPWRFCPRGLCLNDFPAYLPGSCSCSAALRLTWGQG